MAKQVVLVSPKAEQGKHLLTLYVTYKHFKALKNIWQKEGLKVFQWLVQWDWCILCVTLYSSKLTLLI